jgi:diadenosine tetraphosphatase ApaH/serine/threonine PP2A family protein phosphatase
MQLDDESWPPGKERRLLLHGPVGCEPRHAATVGHWMVPVLMPTSRMCQDEGATSVPCASPIQDQESFCDGRIPGSLGLNLRRA